MIEILEAKPIPTAEIVCNNCGSKLRYSNCDLRIEEGYNPYNSLTATFAKRLYFTCPVCGCEVDASWIERKD